MQKINSINTSVLKAVFEQAKSFDRDSNKVSNPTVKKEVLTKQIKQKKIVSKSSSTQKLSSKDRNQTPSAVSSILHAVLAKKGLDKKIGQYSFIQHWHEIVGTELAQKTKPAKIRGECLLINTISSVWAQELSFHKIVILEKLQKFLAEGQVVRNVEFRVGEL